MIKRKTGETISIRVTVKENGVVKNITGGTAKARMKGRNTGTISEGTVAITGASGHIDADYTAFTTADIYDFECVLTYDGETQCVSSQPFSIVRSVYA